MKTTTRNLKPAQLSLYLVILNDGGYPDFIVAPSPAQAHALACDLYGHAPNARPLARSVTEVTAADMPAMATAQVHTKAHYAMEAVQRRNQRLAVEATRTAALTTAIVEVLS